MEQKQSSYEGSPCDQFLPLSAKYPWFVAQNLGTDKDGSTDHIFYTLHDPLIKYQCQIPELLGKRIRGYSHGCVILSDHPHDVMWSIWNPDTSNMINLPPLNMKGDIEIEECCLSAHPDDPSSVLLLTRFQNLVFFRLKSKRKKLRWIEMSYTSQLKRITGEDDGFLHDLSCCCGKVYALSGSSVGHFVIQLDILVKDKEVIIKLLLLGLTPCSFENRCPELNYFLKGYNTQLFCIIVGFYEQLLQGVYFFKLDMTRVKSEEKERFIGLDMSCKSWEETEDLTNLLRSANMWERLVDLKDAIFFVDLAHYKLAYYSPAIASDTGGYIHIRDDMGKYLYSYHVKDNTISISSMPSLVLPTSNVSMWECRLEENHGESKCTLDSEQEEDQIVVRSVTENEIELNESNLLNLPFDILEMIMEHCVGVEYMNFRATCKRCHVVAPLIKWKDESALRRLQAYSLISPWLMVVDKIQGVITFTDPMLGSVYFLKTLHVSLIDLEISCSRFGWVLFRNVDHCLFFNPFTTDLRKLPKAHYLFISMCFSAPPTSPDCMVVGFPKGNKRIVLIHYVAREPSWRTILVDVEPKSVRFPTFFGQDLYALGREGELIGFKYLGEENLYSTSVEAKAPVSCCSSPTQYYLMKCDQDLLIVVVGEFGEHIEVFKRNVSKQEWEKIDSLGKHMIYICGTTCLSIEAKMPEMENKIYIPLLNSKNKKMVFYSLEACKYDTFNGENNLRLKDFLGTAYHLWPHAWIEPSWS